jgi:hypothetical protein
LSKIKNAYDEILDCDLCLGQGVTGWVSPDGDFDFEYCDCNPHGITQDELWAYEEKVSA